MADNRANVIISAQDRASEVLRRLSGTVDGMQRSFEGISAPLLRFQTLWASLIGGAVVGGIRALVSTIDDLNDAAQGLGTTAVQLAAIRQAGAEAGVGAEKLDTALTRLNVTISEANAGDVKAAALFGAFGNKALEAAVKAGDSSRVLRELADEFARMGDGPAKSALAVELFGKAGAAMIPLLNGGAAALERFTGLTNDTVRAAQDLQNEIDRLGATWDRFKFNVGSVAIPAINQLLDAIKRFNETDFQSQRLLSAGSPAAALAQAALALTRSYQQAGIVANLRNRAIEEGNKLSGAEAVEANRGAQAILNRAKADAAAAEAAKKKAAATKESSDAYAKEFADVARIRNARRRFDEEQEDAANRERERRQSRLEDLTGRTAARQQLEDVKALDDAFFSLGISVEEYDAGIRKVFGTNSDTTKGLERQGELAEQLGLQMASSLGELITSGGRAGDVWKALGQDVLKLVTQMLILKPLAKELADIFSGLGSQGGGGSGSSFFGSLLRGIGGAVLGGASGGGQNADGSWGYVDAGRAVTTNVYIDGAVDRARIASYVESGVKAGLAASWDNVARGGTGVLVG